MMLNTVIGYRFSAKKTRIIIKLKLKLVALETELETSAKASDAGLFIKM